MFTYWPGNNQAEFPPHPHHTEYAGTLENTAV